ncbi:MAG: thiamine phosphate synthase [Firmicutes bacterium]|nr:thiamine phosphate synthase [Bacillota bacterium]
MPGAVFHLITDRQRSAGDLMAALGAAVEAGVRWIQIREKTAPAEALYAFGRALQEDPRTRAAALIVNDRADVAMALGAAGVHLARKSLPVAAVRRFLPAGMLLGASVHSLGEALEAAEAGADYVTFGPVFPTRSHPGRQGQGLEALAAVVEAVRRPVLAIGGITPANAEAVLATGAAGVAAIGAVLEAPDPAAAARRLLEALERARSRPRFLLPAAPADPAGSAADARRAAIPRGR